MVGHLACTEVTGDDVPASLNPKIVTDVLRDQLGYDGVIITDSLQMGAVAGLYSSSDIGVRALLAGDDMYVLPYYFAVNPLGAYLNATAGALYDLLIAVI